MMAPISVSVTMVRRWPKCSGVSRTMSTSLRAPSGTLAARIRRLELSPARLPTCCVLNRAQSPCRRGERPAGSRLPMFFPRIHEVGQRLKFLRAPAVFEMRGSLGRPREDQVHFTSGRANFSSKR